MNQASLVRPTEDIAVFFARAPSVEEIATFRLSEYHGRAHVRPARQERCRDALP